MSESTNTAGAVTIATVDPGIVVVGGIRVRTGGDPKVVEQIPLLAFPEDADTFPSEESAIPFTMRFKFRNEAVEKAYQEFSQNKSLIPLIATFCVFVVITASVMLTTPFFQRMLPGDIGLITIVMMVMVVAAIAMLTVGQCKGYFQSPRAKEIFWTFCVVQYALPMLGLQERRMAQDCAKNAAAGRLYQPSFGPQCNFIVDGEVFSVFAVFFIGAPRSIVMFILLPLFLAYTWLWRIAFWRRQFLIYDLFTTLFMVVGAAALHGNEINTRARFIKSQMLSMKLHNTLQARDEVSGMLAAMLANSVLERLVKNEPIADCREATVLFSDVAGFTTWSSSRPPFDVVRMLNTMYRFFDMRLVPYGVEKITTIGDAYWAAANIPTPVDSHADRVCAFALYMQSQIREMHRVAAQFNEIRIRIGVHSGEVSGGIAGSQQLAYQIFGETTEDAELLEQLAPVGGVLISEDTVRLLSDVGAATMTEAATIDRHNGKPLRTLVLQQYAWLPADFQALVADLHLDLESHLHTNTHKASAMASERTRGSSSHRSGVAATGAERQMDKMRRQFLLRKKEAEKKNAALVTAAVGDDTSTSEGESNFDSLKNRISARKFSRVLLAFADEAVEAEFQQVAAQLFRAATRRVHAALAVMMLALFIVLLAEGNPRQTITTYIIYALMVVSSTLVAVFAPRLPPYASFAHFYIVALLQVLVSMKGLSGPSTVTANVKYIVMMYMCFSPCHWSPGLNFIAVTIVNVLFLSVPQFILGTETLFGNLIIAAFGPICVWIVGLQRYEESMRAQFIDDCVAKAADREAAAEQENTNQLLERTVPAFVLPELTAWMQSDRSAIIAHQYGTAATMFCRVPHVVHSLHQLDAVEAMGRVSDIVNLYDELATGFANCVKVKTIGDIMLVVSGVRIIRERQQRQGGAYVAAASVEIDDELALAFAELAAYAKAIDARVQAATSYRCAIGLHAGPLVGGVLGDERLIYDVFGDTVNTTSRIMSTGGEGIRASEAYVAAIGHHAEALQLGAPLTLQLKGRGDFTALPLM